MPATADLPIEVADRAAFFPDADALVCADLHLGRGHGSSIALPVDTGAETVDRLRALLARFAPAEVVVAGDVLHAFTRVPAPTEAAIEDVRAVAADAGAALVLVAGNHDAMLETVADPVDAHRLADGTVVAHGHDEPALEAQRYVIGHDHPAIVIEGRRRPCVLWGPDAYRGAEVIALPAFDRLAAGTRVWALEARAAQSPFLERVGRYHPVVPDAATGETYVFPPVSALREFL